MSSQALAIVSYFYREFREVSFPENPTTAFDPERALKLHAYYKEHCALIGISVFSVEMMRYWHGLWISTDKSQEMLKKQVFNDIGHCLERDIKRETWDIETLRLISLWDPLQD